MDSRDFPRRQCARKHSAAQDLTLPNNSDAAERGFVHASQAPRAASSRAVRRAWSSEFNRVLRQTGDLDQARRAGAELIAAALDCDELAFSIAKTICSEGSEACPPSHCPGLRTTAKQIGTAPWTSWSRRSLATGRPAIPTGRAKRMPCLRVLAM
jgi:hypothetical protein